MRFAKVLGTVLALAMGLSGGLAAQERRAEGWMGIGFEWRGEAAAEATVAQVMPGSAGAQAGVRRGDVVLRIDGEPASEAVVDRLRERLRAGDTVRLRLRREGRELDQAVVAAARPERLTIVHPGEDDVIVHGVPGEAMRHRMDSVRVHVERMMVRMDSLHGRLERLHGDSAMEFRIERRQGADSHHPPRVRVFRRGDSAGVRVEVDSVIVIRRDSLGRRADGMDPHPPRVRVFRRGDSPGARVEVDSVIVIRRDSLGRQAEAEQRRVRAFPFSDLDPGVPFFLEMGRRGVAGAELAEMNPGLARYFRTREGLLVVQVSESTPMARAGVEAGDVIVRAAGAAVQDVADLRRAFSEASGDGKLRLELIREGRSRAVELEWEPMRWRVRTPEGAVREERVRVERRPGA